MNLRRRILFVLLPALLLPLATGCGYQLRGSDSGAGAGPDLSDLRLQMPQSEADFARLLRRRLESSGFILHEADDAAAADFPLLSIGGEAFSGRPASTTVLARAAQVTLRLSIRINLAHDSETLINAETLTVERTHYQDLRNIAGNREEAELLRGEMRAELMAQILRRLEALNR